MKLLVVNPWIEDQSGLMLERILDTETGLVYDKQDSHPAGMTLEEAEEQGREFTTVLVYSLHSEYNEFGNTYIKYEGDAADLLWGRLKQDAERVE